MPDSRLIGDLVFYRRVRGKETADGLADRGIQEAAARAEADRLRSRIEELSGELARAEDSFDAAHAAIARRCGNVIGKRQLEQAVTGAAADIPAFYAARVPEPCTAETLLVLSADCKGIVMRPGALRAATAKAATRLGGRCAPGWPPGRSRTAREWPPWSPSTTPSRRSAARTT